MKLMAKKKTAKKKTTPELTPKHRVFAEEYVLDLNAAQAAVRAGYTKAQGARLMGKPAIRQLVDKLMAERSYETKITHDRLLRELEHVAYSRLDDYRLTNDPENPIVPREGVSSEAMRAVKSIKMTILTRDEESGFSLQKVEFTLHDKMDGIKTGMRYRGMLNDKLTVNVDEELRKVISEAADAYDRQLSRLTARKQAK